MWEGVAFRNLGNAHCHVGDFKAAKDYHERHLKIAKELGDISGEGVACRNLRNIHCHLGDFEAAEDYDKRHLKMIAKDLGDRSGEGVACRNLHNTHCHLGDFEAAREYNERYLKMEKELADRSEERELPSRVGQALRLLGDSLESYRIGPNILGIGAACRNLRNAYCRKQQKNTMNVT